MWVGLPAAVTWRWRGPDQSPLPTIALGTAVCLCLFALPEILPLMWSKPVTSSQSDTYYIAAPSYFLLIIALFMLVLAGLTWAGLRLAKGWPRAGIAPLFWAFHLGAGASTLPFALGRYLSPRRNIDLAEHFLMLNHLSTLGAALTSLALLGLVAVCMIGLGQKALGKGKA